MGDKLSIYNLAAAHLRERALLSLTESSEMRRVFDALWNQVLGEALEETFWKFMLRVVQQDASTTIVPGFGWKYAFTLPVDWVRTKLVSTVETMLPPLLDYGEEAGYLYANYTPLYLSYVSNDTLYGQNLGAWPSFFGSWVSFKLAEYACGKVTGSEKLLAGPEGILKRGDRAKKKAKSNDAMNDPPGQIPAGTWTRSRRGFLRGVPMPGGTTYDDD